MVLSSTCVPCVVGSDTPLVVSALNAGAVQVEANTNPLQSAMHPLSRQGTDG